MRTMNELENKNKELLALCKEQEEKIKELTLKLTSTEDNIKISNASSYEELEGIERLTKQDILNITKNSSFILPRLVGKQISSQIINELLEYKNIEEELGIYLPTLFKALKQKWAYCIYDKKICPMIVCIEYFKDTGFAISSVFGYTYKLKDYGKTWALSKEELK